jgi:hypothetical protein
MAYVKELFDDKVTVMNAQNVRSNEIHELVLQTIKENHEFQTKIEEEYRVDKALLTQFKARLKSDIDADFMKIIRISQNMNQMVESSLSKEDNNKIKSH